MMLELPITARHPLIIDKDFLFSCRGLALSFSAVMFFSLSNVKVKKRVVTPAKPTAKYSRWKFQTVIASINPPRNGVMPRPKIVADEG